MAWGSVRADWAQAAVRALCGAWQIGGGAKGGGGAGGGWDDLESLEQRLLLTAAPQAVNDAGATSEDTPVTIDVLANDLPGDPPATLAVQSVTNGRYGTVRIDGGVVIYKPLADFHGIDSFTYVAFDGAQSSNAATVTVTVASVADAPTAGADAYTVPAGAVLAAASVEQGVLASDHDGDGDPLTASLAAGGAAAHGTLTLNADGTFLYEPAAGFAGEDSFRYVVSDGTATSNIAEVTLDVRAAGQESAPEAANLEYDIAYGQELQVGFGAGLVQSSVDGDGDLLTASLYGSAPAKTAVTVSADGSFTFTLPAGLVEGDFPPAGDVATFTFNYQLSDGFLTGTGTVTIRVHREGATAAGHAYAVVHDRELAVTADAGLLSGSTLGSGAGLTVVNVSACAEGGTISDLNPATGAFTYHPAAGFVGRDSFTYAVSNGVSTSAAATVTIDVSNARPGGLQDFYWLDLASTAVLTISTIDAGLLANDGDGDGDTLTVTGVSATAAGGAVTFAANGTFTYAPPANWTGTDSFEYRVTDGVDASDWIPITVEVVRATPFSAADAYTLSHDRTLTVGTAEAGLLANDVNVGAAAGIAIFTAPTHGNVTVLDAAAGTFSYTPEAGFVGWDLFSYYVCDSLGAGNIATVTLAIANARPSAPEQALTVNEDSVLTGAAGALLAGAADEDGDALTVSLASPAAHGSVVVNADGSFQYTPEANFIGPDVFAYALTDGLLTAEALAIVTVNPVNDLPTITAPSYTIHAARPLTVLAPGVLLDAADVDGDVLTAALVSGPAHGTLVLAPDGSFTYQPAAGAVNISDSFTYSISDGTGATNATASIQIANAAPVAASITYYVIPGTPLYVAATSGLAAAGADPDNDALTVVASTPSTARQYGGFDGLMTDGSIWYGPGTFTGTDTITYTISDGWATSQGTLTFIVAARPIVAYPNAYRTLHGQALSVPAAQGVLYNDWTTVGATSLTAQLLTSPSAGTLTLAGDGGFTFDPPAGTAGSYSFTYQVVDNQSNVSPPVTVTLEVTNAAPILADDAYRVLHDKVLAVYAAQGVSVNDWDLDEDGLTAELVTGPAHGQVTLNANGSFSYQGSANYAGPDSFTYRLRDGVAVSAAATVMIEVANTAPAAAGHEFTTPHDSALAGSLSAGCYDAEIDPLTYRLIAAAAHGTVVIQSNGSYTYTPTAGYVGADSFTYVVNDGVVDSDTATVALAVTNTPPRAAGDEFVLSHGQTLSGNLLANDWDAQGDTLSVSVFHTFNPQTDGITLTWQGNGSFALTPPAAFAGVLKFSYSVFDGAQWSAPAAVQAIFTDTPPVGLADYATTHHDTAVTVSVLANDSDADTGDAPALAWWTTPAVGSLGRQGDNLLYTPPAGFAGEVSFSYYVQSGPATIGPIPVVIQVTNAPPHAVGDYFRTDVGVVLNANVLDNDLTGDSDSLTVLLVTPPAHGTLSFTAGSFSYTPEANFAGADEFTYTLGDGVDTVTATASIAVLPAVLQAINDSFDVPVGAPFTGSLAQNDLPGSLTGGVTAVLESYTGAGQVVVNADGSFTYTPAAGFLGSESFAYHLAKGALSSTAQVRLNVYAPMPEATAQSATVNEDGEVVIDLTAVLAAGWSIATDSLSPPRHGTAVRLSATQIRYTPAADYAGADSFKYAVADAYGQRSTRAAISVTVTAQGDPTIAIGDEARVLEDGSVTIDVLANDADADGAPAGSLSVATPPAHGSVSIAGQNITYTPAENYAGPDSFTYTITNGGLEPSSASVAITVCPVNDSPTGPTSPPVIQGAEDGSVDVSAATAGLFSDVEDGASPRYIEITTAPGHGLATVTGAAGAYWITYAPAKNYHGGDWLGYTAYDKDWSTVTGTITLQVNSVNDPPLVRGEIRQIAWSSLNVNYSVNISAEGLAANDSDPDGGSVSVTSISEAGDGYTAILDDGSIHITPTGGGSAYGSQLWYTVTDSQGQTAAGVLNLWAAPTPPATTYTLAPGESVTYAPSLISVQNNANDSLSGTVGSIQVSFSGRSVSVAGSAAMSYSLSVYASATYSEAYDVSWSGVTATRLEITAGGPGSVTGAQVDGDVFISAGRDVGTVAGHDVTVSAGGDIAAVTAAGAIGSLDAGGDVTGAISAAGDVGLVNIAGALSGSVRAGAGIETVVLGSATAGSSIEADGDIYEVQAAGDLAGSISAGGTISRVTSTAGSIGGAITAGADIGGAPANPVTAMWDVTADITAAGAVPQIVAGRNIAGTIQSTAGAVAGLWAGQTISAAVSAAADIGIVEARLDMTGSLSAEGAVDEVRVWRTLSSAITAGAGIGAVTVGPAAGQNTLAGLIDGATLRTTGGNIGAVQVYGPARPAGQGVGSVTGATINAEAGSVDLVWAMGAIAAAITADVTVSAVTAGESIAGSVAGAGVGQVTSGAGADILAAISATGNIGGVTAGRDLNGTVAAAGNIGQVHAGRDILLEITALGSVGDVSTAAGHIAGAISGSAGLGNISAGGDIAGTLTSSGGSIASITAGAAGSGSILGAVHAAGNIGSILAQGRADAGPADVPSAGLPPIYNIAHLTRSALPPPPTAEPMERPAAAATGGNVAAAIWAGGSIGGITAYGDIEQAVQAGSTLGAVWALGDIAGDIANGGGTLTISAWGLASGAFSAAGHITVRSFGNMTSPITALAGDATIVSWGNLSGEVVAQSNLDVWAAHNVSGALTSQAGAAAITAFGTLSAPVTAAKPSTIFAPTVQGSTILADKTVSVFAWAVENVSATVSAGTVNVVSFGPARLVIINLTGGAQVYATEFGGTIDARGPVTLDVLGPVHADTDVRAHGNNISVYAGSVDGQFDGASVTVDSYGALGGAIQAAAGADVSALGDVTASIHSASTARVFTAGTMSGFVEAAAGVNIAGLGDVTGAVSSTAGDVTVRTFGQAAGPITAAGAVDVTAWAGVMVSLAGSSVTVFSGATMAGSVTAGGAAVVQSLGDVTGAVAAGQNPATPAGAAVTAYGSVSGGVTAAGDVVVSAGQNVAGSLTSQAGAIRLDAGGDVSATANAHLDVRAAAGSFTGATLGSTAGGVSALARGTANLTLSAATAATLLAGGNATVDVTLAAATPEDPTAVMLTALGDLSATIGAAGTVLAVRAGGAADVTASAPVGSASIAAEGALWVELDAGTSVSLVSGSTLEASVSTAAADGLLSLFAAGDITAVAAAGDALEVVSQGELTGIFSAGANPGALSGAASLTAEGGIDADVTAAGAITALTGATLAGSLASQADVTAQAYGIVSAAVTAGGAADVVSATAAVSGNVHAAGEANVMAAGNISGSVWAGAAAVVTSLATITGPVTAIGPAVVSAAGAVSAAVTAGGELSLATGSLSAAVQAGGNLDLQIAGDVGAAATIAADGNVTATVLGALGGNLAAVGDVDVFAGADVAGVQSSTGRVTLLAGGSTTGTIAAALDVSIRVAGSVAGTLTAGTIAAIFAGQDVSAAVTAGDDIQVFALRDVTGSITATAGAAAISAGRDMTGTVTAAEGVAVTAVGNVSGDIAGDVGAALLVGGILSSTITASAGAISISAASIGGATLSAAGDVDVQSVGAATLAATAGGDVMITALGIAALDVQAAGSASVFGANSVSLTRLVAGTTADVYACSSLLAAGGIQAAGDVLITALATSSGWATSTAGDVFMLSAVQTAMNLTAAGDLSLSSLSSVGGVLTAGGTAVVLIGGAMNNLSVSGAAGVRLMVLGGGGGQAHSSAGSIDAQFYSVVNLENVTAAGDLRVRAGGNLGLTATVGGAADVRTGGDFTGWIDAAGSVSVFTLGNLLTDSISGSSVQLVGVLQVDTAVTAAGLLRVTSYGALASEAGMTAGAAGATLWARGNITGSYSSAGDLTVTSFGAIDAELTAARIRTVTSWQDMAGSFQADVIYTLRCAGAITASITCEDLYAFLQHDPSVLGPRPKAPLISLASLRADLHAVMREAWQVIFRLPKERAGLWAHVAAQSAALTEHLAGLSAAQQQAAADLWGELAWSAAAAAGQREVHLAQVQAAVAAADSALQGSLDAAAANAVILRGRDDVALAAAQFAVAAQAANAQADHAGAMTKAAILATMNAAVLQGQQAVLAQGLTDRQEAWTAHARRCAQLGVEGQAWDQDHAGPWGLSPQELLLAAYTGLLQGSYAGEINVYDHLTFKLIPALHNYRNQVWQDVYLAGTGWETGSNVFARIGTEALHMALATKVFNLLPWAREMQIGFGPGRPPFRFHVSYNVEGFWMDATGELFKMEVGFTRPGIVKRLWFMITEIPIFFPKQAMRMMEGTAWTCLGAALRAFVRSFVNWPWW